MKKNLKLIISIIAVIFLVGIGITVAYYSVNVTGNPTADNIEIGAGTVSLEFSDGDSTINIQNVLPGWSAQKTFSVTNTSTATDAELAYNVKLIITENGFPSGSFTYKLDGTGEESANKVETDITSSDVVMGSATITGQGTVHNYTLTLKYKNLSTDQSADMGKVLKGYVTIEANGSVAEEMEPSFGGILADTIIANATEADGLYNYGTAGYRYSGKTPNNYITFNEKTWRIMGFINGSQIGKTSGTYYTKIISVESLFKPWDGKGEKTWYKTSLYNELNGTSSAYINNANIESVNWYHK